ncbi:MAG TPA: tripartite tricarboxylate transporter substrate binding protein [Burkholderiales bacterium]|nr:tripartite tricarboxylate transporter substrate binding protein [Burkholderiales bacterium]
MRKLLLVAMLAFGTTAAGQGYPAKPVRLIVADAAGGAPDQLGRLVAQKLSESLGQQMIVDNRPGAAGVLGADLAAKAPADGYTLLLTTTSIYALIPSMKKNLPYDPVKDFVAITRIATASNVLVVNAALPATSVAELIALARGKPGVYNYASAGIGSPAHLAGEMLNLLAGIKITHVPYKGAAPGLLDVIAGNPHLIITSPISAAGHMNAGRVRALATTGAQRNPRLPDLPTIADTVPGYEISQTWGLATPAGTPAAIITRLSSETIKAMHLADVKDRVLAMGAVPAGDSPAEFQAYIARERERLGDVIAKTGIVLAD